MLILESYFRYKSVMVAALYQLRMSELPSNYIDIFHSL